MADQVRSPEYDALLAGVLAAPADRLPRLVLADWCDEYGRDDEGRIIRAAWPADFNRRRADHRGLGARLAVLRYPAGVPTNGAWPRTADGASLEEFNVVVGQALYETWAYVRDGFVVGLSMPSSRFQRQAGEWFARNPITYVRFTDCPFPEDGLEPASGRGPYDPLLHGWARSVARPRYRSIYGVPAFLFDALAGSAWSGESNGRQVKCYRSKPAALAALSDVAVGFGRRAARLPELAPTHVPDEEG